MNKRKIVLALMAATMVVGCATDDPNRQAKTGAVIGAVAGAVLGHQLDDDSGRYVGAAVGALAGGGVGYYMDNQEKDFNQAMADERQQNAIQIERMRDDTLKLSLDSEVSFDFDRAEIKPAFRPSLDKLGDLLIKYNRTIVHVVGHTDNIGSDGYNRDLSLRRADSVVGYLISRGVPGDRMRTEGRGESEPRATNDTEAGRQLNRRVEVYVKPVVEGQEQRAYESPRYY
ncbi:OmpA family protein [Pseudomonadota bacterium]